MAYFESRANRPDPEGIEPDPRKSNELIAQRIEIRRLLGQGGFGSVYAAFDRQRDEFCAVKKLNRELLTDARAQRLFEKEATIWVLLPPHENIVHAYEVFRHSGSLYILMEWIIRDSPNNHPNSGTLTELILTSPEALPLQTAIRWALEISEGMRHAQKYGIHVHRDLKPGNILISSEKRAKVTDFGLASAAGKAYNTLPIASTFHTPLSEHAFTIVQSNNQNVCGTLGYIAPEILGGEPASERSDIFSFGVTLFNIATGSLNVPRDPNQWPFQPSAGIFDPIVKKCVALDPTMRFSYFSEVSDALRDLQSRWRNNT